jgi:ribosomal 30S subunit maturation factor RimM
LFIPAIHDIVKNIDLEKRRITISMVDGLIW